MERLKLSWIIRRLISALIFLAGIVAIGDRGVAMCSNEFSYPLLKIELALPDILVGQIEIDPKYIGNDRRNFVNNMTYRMANEHANLLIAYLKVKIPERGIDEVLRVTPIYLHDVVLAVEGDQLDRIPAMLSQCHPTGDDKSFRRIWELQAEELWKIANP